MFQFPALASIKDGYAGNIAQVGSQTCALPISPSSGERTGISPNHPCYGMCGVVGPRSRKTVIEKKRLESRAIDGDSPVF